MNATPQKSRAKNAKMSTLTTQRDVNVIPKALGMAYSQSHFPEKSVFICVSSVAKNVMVAITPARPGRLPKFPASR